MMPKHDEIYDHEKVTGYTHSLASSNRKEKWTRFMKDLKINHSEAQILYTLYCYFYKGYRTKNLKITGISWIDLMAEFQLTRDELKTIIGKLHFFSLIQKLRKGNRVFIELNADDEDNDIIETGWREIRDASLESFQNYKNKLGDREEL